MLQSDVQSAVIQCLYKLQLKEIWPEDFPTRTDLLPAIGYEEHYMQVWKQPICAYLEPWLFRFTDKGNWYQKGMKTFLMLREVLKDFFESLGSVYNFLLSWQRSKAGSHSYAFITVIKMALFLWRHAYAVCNTYKLQFSEVLQLRWAPVACSWVCAKLYINTIVFCAHCWVEQRVKEVTVHHFHGGQPGSWSSYFPTAAKYTRVVHIKLNSCYVCFIFFCELHANLMRTKNSL